MWNKIKRLFEFYKFTLVECYISGINGFVFSMVDIEFDYLINSRSLFSINTNFKSFITINILFIEVIDYDKMDVYYRTKNKDLPDWLETDPNNPKFIKSKPNLEDDFENKETTN